MITKQQLIAGMGVSADVADWWDDYLNEAMDAYEINSKLRIAAFLAQIGHESGRLHYTTEIWGPTRAQKRYEGRRDLGNIYPGDGKRFRGHGLIQITGRANHKRTTQRLKDRFPHLPIPDFSVDPDKLALPRWAALSAADFWDMKNLNRLADAQQFLVITKSINGGYNGLSDRKKLYQNFLRVL